MATLLIFMTSFMNKRKPYLMENPFDQKFHRTIPVLLLTVLSICIFSAPVKAGTHERIMIDHMNWELMAPEGTGYQWYLNGIRTGVGGERLGVKESGLYRVEFKDKYGNRSVETIRVSVTSEGIRRIYIIGDSTVATYNTSDYPMTGWGQVLSLFLEAEKVEVVNKAIGGRSSRTFYEEGRWAEVAALLDSSDYVFVQFGHNDRDWSKPERYTDTAAYKDYLRIYVNGTREKGAIPVLVSPMVMNAWSGNLLRNVFTEGENDYRGAMLEVAEELDALFVDLNMESWELVDSLGLEYATYFIYMGLEPGEYPNYPDGRSDGTHFQEMGALQMARLVVEGISELAADPSMAFLDAARTPTAAYNTAITSPDAGLVTLPGTFPAGASITLKTRIHDTYAFDHWEDSLGTPVSDEHLLMFTLDGSSPFYSAVVSDCNGEVGGEAFMDACMFCAGGQTDNSPCLAVFECEDACSYTGNKRISYIGGTQKTVVNTSSVEGTPGMQMSFDAEGAGNYGFVLFYHSVTEGELLFVSLNGEEVVAGLDLVQTAGWDPVWFDLDLEEGLNSVVITTSATQGGILFDMLGCYSAGISEGICNTSISPSEANTGIIAYPNPFTDAIVVQSEHPFEYRVYNTQGIEVLQGSSNEGDPIGSDLPEGLYLLRIAGDRVNTVRIISKE